VSRRHDLRIEAIRRLGAWERPHPYVGALIGADALAGVLPGRWTAAEVPYFR
jgi:hypothetical protein